MSPVRSMPHSKRAVRTPVGMKGEFLLIEHDVSGLVGSGPNGAVMFEDLWARSNGVLVPRHPGRTIREMRAPNKILKRGLTYLMFGLFRGHDSVADSDLVPSDITYNKTTSPWVAFFLSADYPEWGSTYVADVRPQWDESDGQFQNPQSLAPAPTLNDGTTNLPRAGKRSCIFNGTADSAPGLRRVSTAHINNPPYGELEAIFYAESQIASLVKATGYVDLSTATMADGDYITLDDGINLPVIIEFDNNSSVTAGTLTAWPWSDDRTSYVRRIRCAIGGTNQITRDNLVAVINSIGDYLYISAEADNVITTRCNLTHYAGGEIGNDSGSSLPETQPVTENVADAAFVVSGMTGGTNPSMTGREIDNLPVKSLGIAEGKDCGQGENANRLAVRSIVGIAPTIQGLCDRAYVHEITDYSTMVRTVLHKYLDDAGVTYQQDIGSQSGAAGYVTRSGAFGTLGGEDSRTTEFTFPSAPNPTLDLDNNTIEIPSAEWILAATIGFDTEHVRWVINATGTAGGSNDNQYWHIKKIINPRKVEIFESMVGAGTETGAITLTLHHEFLGELAFDGNVENEGLTYDPTPPIQDVSDPWTHVVVGEKWVSEQNLGPHILGRIFATPLSPSGAPKSIKGYRIIAPPGVQPYYLPDQWDVDILDGGGSPPATIPDDLRPGFDNHWTNINSQASQADTIYNAGQYGVEYTFSTPQVGYGLRLSQMQNQGTDSRVEIGEFLIFEEPADIGPLSSHRIALSVDGGVTYQYLDVPDQAATKDMNLIVDALNAALVGYQVEAVRSQFGYLWVRGTVQGDNSDFRLKSSNDGSTVNVLLGLASGAAVAPQRAGLTQIFRKLTKNAATFIYRWSLLGNLPDSV